MIISRTPFRISFFGGGTDYPEYFKENPGASLVTTIDKYCYISCRYLPPFFEHHSRLIYSKIEAVEDNFEFEHPAVRETLRYLNIKNGLEIHHDADLPARTGLGSSSAFTVGLLNALYNLKGEPKPKEYYEQQAIFIERDYCKEYVGFQDQIATCQGGLNYLRFYYENGKARYEVEKLRIPEKTLQNLQDHLMLFYTGVSRISSTVAKNQVENIPQRKEELKRMYEMVGEGVRILTGLNSDIQDFGRLLHEGWLLKKSLSDKVSNELIDTYYQRALDAGAIGGKILGAGGGGFLLIFVSPILKNNVRLALGNLLEVPFKFETTGTQIIVNHEN